ncbi:hypothetical protein BJ123_104207 [Rhodopseudomonas thermotolerans]|uniref:Uncharacterized protein n=2 Tax=Rhodopseudomonas TaxID=1073 RepID=A0A336JJM1_9BRAD|nr:MULTISPECIES: hypothetical protein [Rhodopseudomonas]RED38454.1 hypothetical protein BJ125_104207 [Rhodopseudomonas pentothenatexigens]REG06039.1 hypothetical protein BJ123_104207 [Rhodopseudomonas thermotolerans]SSW89907.1 hypothetical protein SAMN05892882_104207 [Rhodopseudomonas pentothenatexigens]
MTPFRYRSRTKEFSEAFAKQVAAELQKRCDELISPRNAQKFSHGRRWMTKPTGHGDDTAEMQAHSFEVLSRFDDVLNHDLAKFVEARKCLVEGLMAQFQATLYQTISQSTEKSGNTVVVGPGQSPAEAFLAALEMIEFGVDEYGEVSLPQFHMGRVGIKKLIANLEAQGPEFSERVEQVKAEKSKLARQRESERLAKFPPAWEGDSLCEC